MAHLLPLAALAFAVSIAPTALASEPVTCVASWGEARFAGYAYNHIVHLKSACDRAVTCRVSTDVNPEPTSVTVPAGEEREVVTFRGSPASAFTPKVACEAAK